MRCFFAILLLSASGTLPAQDFLELRRNRDYCAADRLELRFALSSAIESGDVNRIAAIYDWNGMGANAGRGVMDRLEAIAARTLVDVVPVHPPDPVDPALPAWHAAWTDRPPIALRVEQVVAGTATQVSTTFSMHRRLGCWWVSL